MKIPLFLPVLLVLFSCHKDKTIEGQDIRITLQSDIWQDSCENTEISSLHLFAIDRDNQIIRHETYTSQDIHEHTINTLLPLGRYRLALVANSSNETLVTSEIGESVENLFLHLPQNGNSRNEADDFQTAFQSVSITENKTTIPPIRLFRRVGKLQVTVNSIPEDVSDVNLELLFVSTAINFTGTNTNSSGSIIKPINGQGQVELLTFPTKKGEATLSITYRVGNTAKRKIIPFVKAIDTNKLTRINCDFPDLQEGGIQGNGKNLLQNGDFESWSNPEKEPDNWHFYKDGKDSIAIKITGEKVHSQNQAVFLQGKTYLYQDVGIEAGKRYEIKMHVNAPSPSFPWKYYCYWRKSKSTALPAENNKAIQAQSYQKQTNGWNNIFHGVFTAPESAKLLRIEIRTYGKGITPEEGIYIDDFSVELVE